MPSPNQASEYYGARVVYTFCILEASDLEASDLGLYDLLRNNLVLS